MRAAVLKKASNIHLTLERLISDVKSSSAELFEKAISN